MRRRWRPRWATICCYDAVGNQKPGQPVQPAVGVDETPGAVRASGQKHLARLTQALWAAMGIVLLLGLAGGLFVSRNLERSMSRLNRVVTAVQEGDLKARAPMRNSGDEFDELGQGLNVMLDRLEASMASIRHAGDAIAHDLRSPLTRMRAKLEVALIDAEAGQIDGVDALQLALDEADSLLKTFNTVLAIARLQAAAGSGRTPPAPASRSRLTRA